MKLSQFILSILILSVIVYGQEYQVDKAAENSVKFISDAPIEDFEGITDKIDGYLYLPPDNDPESSEIYFEVDLRTLDTGIGLRNQHMRENYLETDKYPYAVFEGKVESLSSEDDTIYVEIEGKMKIHGTTKDFPISGKMIKTQKGFFVTSLFDVKLTDFNIDVPKFMFLKIDETMKLEVKFYLKEVE